MSEPTLTQEDKEDLESLRIPLEGETPRALLDTWSQLLDSIELTKAEPIAIVVAARIVASWPFLTFQETARYHELYHDLLIECRAIVRDYINDNPGCLNWVGDEDVENNHAIYTGIIVDWNLLLDRYESEWLAEDDESHLWVAVIADTRAFLFSGTGMIAHLDAIGYQLSNEDFLAALAEAQEANGE